MSLVPNNNLRIHGLIFFFLQANMSLDAFTENTGAGSSRTVLRTSPRLGNSEGTDMLSLYFGPID